MVSTTLTKPDTPRICDPCRVISLLPPKLPINPIVNKADHEAQHAADEEADSVLDGAVVFDIYHDQFDDADHR